MFKITSESIASPLITPDHASGAVVAFEGTVRNQNEGQPVEALEYESYIPLAEKEGSRIIEAARERYEIQDAACVHRIGLLNLGDVAIRVEVASAHRRQAFEACEFIVDEVKRRVPIWKKEHYASGVSGWINVGGERDISEEAFYHRQQTLSEVGKEGQERLRSAHVLVVGAGGLGSSALPYLTSSGVGTITVVDSDVVEISNLHRQPLFRSADVGSPKAERAAERLRSLNPFVEIRAHTDRIAPENIFERLQTVDLVIDCTDNFHTKLTLNRACVQIGTPLITASIDRFDGQLLLVRPDGPCLRCLWPVEPQDGCVGSCEEDGVLGFVPGVVGTFQAGEAIKAILKIPTATDLCLIDLRQLDLKRLKLPKDPNCPVCGVGKEIPTTSPVVDAPSHGDMIVDIRELEEVTIPLPGSIHLPLSTFDAGDPRLGTDARVLLVCAKGMRSLALADRLRAEGHRRFFSLRRGANAITRRSDSSRDQ